jgi:hypothetical protein
LERQAHAGTPVADGNVLTRIRVQPARMERAAAGLSVDVAIFLFFSIRCVLPLSTICLIKKIKVMKNDQS